jgi:hypothetical protein
MLPGARWSLLNADAAASFSYLSPAHRNGCFFGANLFCTPLLMAMPQSQPPQLQVCFWYTQRGKHVVRFRGLNGKRGRSLNDLFGARVRFCAPEF